MKIKISSSPLLILTSWGKIYKRYFYELSNSTRLLKSCFFLLVIFPFFISDSIAQNFFPLKVGNIYQVKDDWFRQLIGYTEDGTFYYPLTISRDTLIGGEAYYLTDEGDFNLFIPEPSYFSYDSISQKIFIWNTEDSSAHLAVDLNAPFDSHYVSFIRGAPIEFISNGISVETALGETHLVYSMVNSYTPPRWEYKFASDIGFLSCHYDNWGYQYGFYSNGDVITAFLDSTIINPLILSIDTLYPIQDRPVDTFPYLLNINYTASYKELIDSFYLSVEHIRVDTLVQTKHYAVDWWNPHLTLFLPGLQAGDKVKLRATITDTSIFYNTAHYPDTGWVIINVLPPILSVEEGNLPLYYELAQNFPNPFNPITTIRYQIPEPAFINIKIYDVLGNEIESLVQTDKVAGSYEIEFDGSALTSGIYYYRLMAGFFSQTKKMILLK